MDMSFLHNTNKRYRYIHINGFSLGLGLKRRRRATRKWLFLFNCLSSVEKWKLPPYFHPRFRTKQKQNKLECSVFQALGLCGQGAAKNKEKKGAGETRGDWKEELALCFLRVPPNLCSKLSERQSRKN